MPTNFDRITQSPETLADALFSLGVDEEFDAGDDPFPYCNPRPGRCEDHELTTAVECRQCLIDWLNQPVEDDSGLTPEEIAEYAKARREGRLLTLPIAFGQRLWQEDCEKIREWSVDMMQFLRSGDGYIVCVDIVDGEPGEDYETFDMASIGHNLKLARPENPSAPAEENAL